MPFASVVKKPNNWCSPTIGFAFVPRTPRHDVQIPAKAKSGRLSSSPNQIGVFFGFASAFSQNALTGTRQRFNEPSQRRQWGLDVLRIFVIGALPNCGGPGMSQRIISSRRPSVSDAITGAGWSGNTPGIGGRLPVRSLMIAKRRRMAPVMMRDGR
jgi:hypothetical protein